MRLLEIEADGAFSLGEYLEEDIPRYAILSHRWGADHEEVTFRDLVEGTGKSKAGYRKLTFCGKQAANDGLRFFWIDTCCIDKASSTELSEAVNSMFRWYQHAEKCYVYLSDVSTSALARNEQFFQSSSWFTRGWTLQELVAPVIVEFFSSDGDRIGDRSSLVEEIHRITSIPIEALQGTPLAQFSVEERMSWAENRETKRQEDAAYSLLGIFDIHMPLIYGEGKKKAIFRLLKEIREYPNYAYRSTPKAYV
ncbi:heterokaryon incompatibility protein-domain-containing protein [Paraphoma chrysanthemicola]|nr:heterokaryon incompatibility protein-domain-containing protein [Paraphoma chrysanthemicola]